MADHRVANLPDAWVDRIFKRMAGLYGSKIADLWSGTKIDDVKELWAERLAGFATMPAAIGAALDSLDSKLDYKGEAKPPNLPEFLAMCREEGKRIQEQAQASTPKLEGRKLSADEQRERSEKFAAAAKKKPGHDYRAWMATPASPLAAIYAQKVREDEAAPI